MAHKKITILLPAKLWFFVVFVLVVCLLLFGFGLFFFGWFVFVVVFFVLLYIVIVSGGKFCESMHHHFYGQ